MPNPLWTHDRKAAKGLMGVVGVDEAGRGCLAGPVVAGAALLPVGFFGKAANRRRCAEVNDSKQLDEAKREAERLKDDFIGTEHLFIAATLESQGDSAQVLKEFGIVE